MKTKFLIVLMLGLSTSTLFAQFRVTGTYSTTFGDIKLVEENNIIYGDYGSKGTIIGEVTGTLGSSRTIKGTFYNNSNQGSFEWIFTQDRFYKKKFTGKYGWGNSLSSGAWNGTEKNSEQPNDLKFALWSGKWTTTYGDLVLKQNGEDVTGTYRNIGTISAKVKDGNRLEGSFTNNGTKGTFSFTLKDDSFEGKWGWGNSIGNQKWTGNKALKTGVSQSSSSSASSSSAASAISTTTIRYRVKLLDIEVLAVDDGPEGIYAGYELFGIAWCRAFDYQQNQINPFDVTYLDRFGRFWEIKPTNYIKTDLKVGVSHPINQQITFDIPFPSNIPKSNILRDSKVVLTVELKDYDKASSVDILGKETITIPLNEAIKYTQGGNPGIGKLNFSHGSGRLTVSYQLEIL